MHCKHRLMLDVKRLAHVVALADERHFARAAERVHLSQPAFSRSIQSIEQELGMRLFDRETGEVKTTAAGLFVIERARKLLFDARCLHRDVALYRDTRLGDTAFGAGPFPAATLVMQVLPRLRREHPQVGLRVEVSNWQLLLERLLAEDIEFFVSEVRDLPADPRLEVTSLGRQRGHLHVRAGHPLAGRMSAIADAWRYGVAATKLPVPVKEALARLLGLPRGAPVPLAIECDDVTLLRATALCTDTVLAATDAAVRADVESGALLQLAIEGLPLLYSDMGIVTLQQRTPSPMALRVMARLREAAAEVNER
jgi:DNA-binding transcriptional LysR family regulator